ncbi:MAG: hypothetical protein KDK90_27665 [Leptospiraceae bacterium]|nr:hypothetical protein [Leptospiraceae bacterium]
MEKILIFIESHPELNKIIFFVIGILIVWISGFFKLINLYIGKLDTKLRLEIVKGTARYLYLKEYPVDNTSHKRFAIWLNLTIANPSDKLVSVKSFELQFINKIGRLSDRLFPITFPNVPRINVGNSIKLFPVFFSRFLEMEKYTNNELFSPDGKILSGDLQTGYLLFMEEYKENLLPKIENELMKIKITCIDIKGKKFSVTGTAKRIQLDEAKRTVPGIDSYVDEEKYLVSANRLEGLTNS